MEANQIATNRAMCKASTAADQFSSSSSNNGSDAVVDLATPKKSQSGTNEDGSASNVHQSDAPAQPKLHTEKKRSTVRFGWLGAEGVLREKEVASACGAQLKALYPVGQSGSMKTYESIAKQLARSKPNLFCKEGFNLPVDSLKNHFQSLMTAAKQQREQQAQYGQPKHHLSDQEQMLDSLATAMSVIDNDKEKEKMRQDHLAAEKASTTAIALENMKRRRVLSSEESSPEKIEEMLEFVAPPKKTKKIEDEVEFVPTGANMDASCKGLASASDTASSSKKPTSSKPKTFISPPNKPTGGYSQAVASSDMSEKFVKLLDFAADIAKAKMADEEEKRETKEQNRMIANTQILLQVKNLQNQGIDVPAELQRAVDKIYGRSNV